MAGFHNARTPAGKPRGLFIASTGPRRGFGDMTFGNSFQRFDGVLGSGCYSQSQVYKDFSCINAASGVKSKATYFDIGTYRLSS